MTTGDLVTIVGSVAAVCTTFAFVPQIRKIRQTGGREVSYAMLSLYVVGVGLWLYYGILIRAPEVIIANAVSVLFSGVCIAIKFAMENRNVPLAAEPGRRKRIAIDMDETTADSLKEHLRRYNQEFGENLTREDLRGGHLEDHVPADRRAFAHRMVHDETFFENLDPMPGSQETIRELMEKYEIFIVSSAMEVPESFAAKLRWLSRHFPFVPASHIVFCGDKGIINADYLIDDTPRHFAGFAGEAIIFSAPHNAQETRYRRVESWDQVREIFLGSPREKRAAKKTQPQLTAIGSK
jgi:5'(3')-deoxyribonucleotidase/uncharacterized protein with PQ loop repeat